jgi:UDP-N-acetylglucosamine--N-acetylmuramyl-(pentapeptide) pyrophosphoryl-undecaprenol N-acetylglucosamine transferase
VISESTIGHTRRPLRLVIAGGGTGGHISPAVAVVEELRTQIDLDILWIGSSAAFEREAAQQIGASFEQIHTGKLRRYASLETLADTLRVQAGAIEAFVILRRFRPDVVFSTGGFVSVPTVVAARMLRIPSLTHEQTAYIGLATKINARSADVVALSFETSRKFLGRARGRIAVTGNPVRSSVLSGDPQRGLSAFGLSGEKPLVYVTGGAQGARALNAVVGASLPELLGYVELVHQCGPRTLHDDVDRMQAIAAALPEGLRARYRAVERVGDELGDLYAASALVAGRAGAGTVNELSALGLPALLIPLPGAEEQRQNALVLAEKGQGRVLSQADCTPERFTREVIEMIADRPVARPALANTDALAAAKRLATEILALAKWSTE